MTPPVRTSRHTPLGILLRVIRLGISVRHSPKELPTRHSSGTPQPPSVPGLVPVRAALGDAQGPATPLTAQVSAVTTAADIQGRETLLTTRKKSQETDNAFDRPARHLTVTMIGASQGPNGG